MVDIYSARRNGKTLIAIANFIEKTRGMRNCTIYIRERQYPIFLRQVPEEYRKELEARNVEVKTIPL